MSDINPCCKVEDNLILQPKDREDVSIRICKVCGKRHFEMIIEKGVLGMRGISL